MKNCGNLEGNAKSTLPTIIESSSQLEKVEMIETMPTQPSSPLSEKKGRKSATARTVIPAFASPQPTIKSATADFADNQPIVVDTGGNNGKIKTITAYPFDVPPKARMCRSLVASEWLFAKLSNSETKNDAANCSYAHHDGEICGQWRRTRCQPEKNYFRKTARCAHASTPSSLRVRSHRRMIYCTQWNGQYVFMSSAFHLIISVVLCRYDYRTKEWTFVARMLNARRLFSLAVAHGFSYAIAQARRKFLKLVERYDADANTWEEVGPLKTPRSTAAVAVHRSYGYVVGGATVCNEMETATVERHNKLKKK